MAFGNSLWTPTPEQEAYIQAERRRAIMAAVEACRGALTKQRTYLVPISCPDDKEGCLVLHQAAVSRVPMTRRECLESLMEVTAEQVLETLAVSP